MSAGRGTADGVEHGFPHLETVREAITALYRRLSHDGVQQYGSSVLPADVAFGHDEELYAGAQRIARVMVGQLRLPQARMVVGFREMEFAASVELETGPEYFVELNSRFKEHRRDIGAALAHEVTHVALHRLGLEFPTTAENEVLTDTVAAYLGAGWLLLDAFRQDAVGGQKLGYLTPEEFGYVLARRARVFGEDPAVWFTSPQAYEAYARGRELADREARRPPLAGAGWAARQRYAADRVRARSRLRPGAESVVGGDGYRFDRPAALRVSFRCPVCAQRLGAPVRGRVRVRCGVCRTELECDT
ncbi:hypothetical protein MTQ01_10470 [Streptomyces sp. XM4193]|uniref:hypothetical protein n=1 Tax=Streptomyces sp. XM4193 TaxID=2929782 RepID=UPI001FFA0432|nr:hypothetical protein [Streptomyces sp. XM4193]MCK1796423.1 hypothetical protein [Streptomyces sp. XM4193]